MPLICPKKKYYVFFKEHQPMPADEYLSEELIIHKHKAAKNINLHFFHPKNLE